MAEKTKDAESGESEETASGEGEQKPQKRRLAGKTIILFIVLPAVLLIAGGGAGAYYSGLLGSDAPDAPSPAQVAEAESKAAHPPPTFLELPDIVVNLSSSGRKSTFLKLNVSLEVESAEDGGKLKALTPRIVDSFQVYLRDLRVEDLQGSEGIYRVREELLRRVNAAAEPVKVSDVLFRELLVQ